MTITVVFDPPLLSDSPAVFNSKAFTLVGDLNTFSSQANSTAQDVNNDAGASATSEANAATSAYNAAISETNAATSAGNAATSETNAAASYDAFDDRFLGAKSADPTLDNDGNTLLVGALYWSTTFTEMRAWSGSAWVTTSVANAVSRGGDTMTGALVVPSGASGSEAISADDAHTRADEVILNGGFSVSQETLGSRTDDTYGHDGWIVLTQTGAVAVSTLSDAEDGTPKMARFLQSQVAAQRFGYLQVIEGQRCRHLRGQQVTFRFGRMRLSASANVRVAILEWTGTEDAVTSDVVADWTSASYTAGGFFNATTLTVSGVTSQALTAFAMTDGVPLTVTLGSTFNNLMVFVWTESAIAQNEALDLGKAQLDIGGAARPFRHHHSDRVLLDCSRFVTPVVPAIGYAYATTAAVFVQSLPVRMRATPAVSGGSTQTLTNNSGSPLTVTSLVIGSILGNTLRVDGNVASGLAQGDGTFFTASAGSLWLARL